MSRARPFKVFAQQTIALTQANLKSRYRGTLAGFLWVILNPVLMFGVQSLVFKKVLKLGIDHYLVFLLSGLLPWIFIVQTLEMCTSIFISMSGILKSVQMNPLVCLCSQILDNFINFIAAFLIILIPVWIYDPSERANFAILPIPMFLLILGVVAFSWLLATAQVFFRDTRFLVTFGTGVAFFLTPVFYPIDFIPKPYQWIASINPFYRLIEPFRLSIYSMNYDLFWPSCAKALLMSAALFALAAMVWNNCRGKLYANL
jgi:ABC-type polysaccharide/polyol phosphate export permease